MKNISVGKENVNIKDFLGSILRELAELVGPAPVGGTTSKDNNATLAVEVSKIEAQESTRKRELERMFDDYSNQEKGKEKSKDKEKKASRSEIRTKVENPMKQTSRQTEKGSKGRTNEGNEQEL